jgi:GntR family transcriptional regulator, arabinose operon transcriptional repressor
MSFNELDTKSAQQVISDLSPETPGESTPRPAVAEREKLSPARQKRREFKYVQVKTDLSIRILEGQLRPHDRIPSLNEIVEKYGVSKITARRVLQELTSEGLVYVTRGSGTFVADAAPRQMRQVNVSEQTIGVVFTHAAGAFMSEIIMGIDEEAFTRNAQINLSVSNNSYEREAEILQRLVRQGVRRILMFMVLEFNSRLLNPNIPLYLRLQENGVKLLFLGCNVPGLPLPSVTYDDYDAYRRLVRVLKEKGRRRLLCVVRNDNASSTIERVRAFKDGVLEFGLPFSESQLLEVDIESHNTLVSDTARRVTEFLRKNGDVDGIVCSDEMIAGGVVEALDACGIPADQHPLIGGMGIARNLHVLRGHPYVLLEEDTRRLGREATALMLNEKLALRGEVDRSAFHKIIQVPIRVPKTLR